MGFRFHRSVRLAKGLRLNFSKSGASLSVGGPGATVNLGRRGPRATVGLPGTGLSYSSGLRLGRLVLVLMILGALALALLR